jgi:hypothetical protein
MFDPISEWVLENGDIYIINFILRLLPKTLSFLKVAFGFLRASWSHEKLKK